MSLLHPKVFTLPQELIDSVIDAIEDDTSTLMAVGLVGKQWYRRSRVHLFKQMHLGGRPNPADRLSQLTQLIERQPILLEYIKELNLSHAHEWLTTNVEIIELLPRLSLKSLEIGGMDWARLPPKLQSALYDRIVDPGLVALSLECIDNMDITALTNRHHLKELIIDEVCINNKKMALWAVPEL